LAPPTDGSCGAAVYGFTENIPLLRAKCDSATSSWDLIAVSHVVPYEFKIPAIQNPLTMNKINSTSDCSTLNAFDGQLAAQQTFVDCLGVDADLPVELVDAHENLHVQIETNNTLQDFATLKDAIRSIPNISFDDADTENDARDQFAVQHGTAVSEAVLAYYNSLGGGIDQHVQYSSMFIQTHASALNPFRAAIANKKQALGCP